jgi:hypothetical protein
MKRSVLLLVVVASAVVAGGLCFVAFRPQGQTEAQVSEIDPEASTARRESGVGAGSQDATSDVSTNLARANLNLRESIRRRVEEDSHMFTEPKAPALRSPSGEIDPLQCMDPKVDVCDNAANPFAASSWDEAQWMRARGFVDEQQLRAAGEWSDDELDQRYRSGDSLAVLELARRFSANEEPAAARRVLSDAVRLGNVRAAHELAAMEYGTSHEWYATPGLEWLFVARRLGDGGVTMSYVMQRYPGLQSAQIDQAMTAADRVFERLNLQAMPIQRRPGSR